MQCPNCEHENPEGKKFCRECGRKLDSICPQCNAEILPGDKFCGECGHDLTVSSEPSPRELSFEEKLDKIQRYLPEGLTQKILSQRDRIEGERKHVTVMFCDMEGFTSLVEKLGPDEAYGIIDEVYEILIHKVHEYEGTVNEMTGDGVMALFGAPIALEDAPQRAIRSAMAVHREMARFSDRMRQEKEGVPPLRMRIGIHTGPVVVGTLGNNLRVEFKAVGDTVNVASRMEGLAESGTIYVSGETFDLTQGFFRFEGLGERKVKGRERPVRVYRVLEASTRRTRFDVSAERGLTPLAGRERELELLLDAYERSRAGRGQAMSIVSEAGVGKSRLLYEFRKRVSSENVTFLEGKCLSYSRNVAYHPVTDVLRGNFDIEEGDDDARITQKVKDGLNALNADEASTLPYLLELLSVKESGLDRIPMSPEAKRHRIATALNHIVLKGSEIRPLILAFEDLHWIDRSSEDTLKSLLDNIAGARVFLIFTYRPEYIGSWGGKSYHSQVNLNRLSNRESLSMVAHLLGTEDIAPDLEELILQKTEGVPFFIEEFLRSLRDLKIITKSDGTYQLGKEVQSVAIPSTIQDVIMARVDSLPEGAKEVLQTGSVIEREFSYELIKQVMGVSESELITHLSELKDAELLYERGVHPETTYIFKHALTREVLYDSILRTKAIALHETIGNVIEGMYKDNIHELYEVLAEHYGTAGNYHKAAEYSKLAGKKAAKTGSVKDAIAFAHRNVEYLERLPHSEELETTLVSSRTALGLYYLQLNDFLRAKEAIDPVIDEAVKHDLKKSILRMYNILGMYYGVAQGEPEEGLEYLRKATELSIEVGDLLAFTQGNFWLGVVLSLICDFDQASRCFNKALDMGIAAKSLWGISTTKSNWAYFVYCSRGNYDKAYELSKEAVDLAEESGDVFSKSWAYLAYGLSCYVKGRFQEAIRSLSKGSEYCERIDAVSTNSLTHLHLARVHFANKNFEDSARCFRQALVFAEDVYQGDYIKLLKIALEMARVMSDFKNVHLQLLRDYATDINIPVLKGWAYRYMGQIFLRLDSDYASEAEAWIRKAIQADTRTEMRFALGRDFAVEAEFFKQQGDNSKAKENLAKAIDILKDCGADRWVKKYEEELASIS